MNGIHGNSALQMRQQPLGLPGPVMFQVQRQASTSSAWAPMQPQSGRTLDDDDKDADADVTVYPPWRSLLDNFAVECLATLVVQLATLLCWELQPVPALMLGLSFLCIKDEDYFFPDGSPTVTLVIWVLGGYSWTHALMRVLGQLAGVTLAVCICLADKHVSMLAYRVEHTTSAVFALELVGTLVEHMAVVYVLLPLLPPSQHPTLAAQNLLRVFPKVKPKSHSDTRAPSNQAVVHAAVILSTLHWCLAWGFCVEMAPMGTLARSVVLSAAHHESTWDEAILAWWGQVVGVAVCLVYVALYTPRQRPAHVHTLSSHTNNNMAAI